MINCLAYIDLNPIRAALVDRPEDYRWSSLGYHIQTENKDNFLSLDFGPVEYASLSLRELNRASLKEFCVMDSTERLRRYRRYVYGAGALKPADGKSSTTIDEKVLEKERKTDFEITRLHRNSLHVNSSKRHNLIHRFRRLHRL